MSPLTQDQAQGSSQAADSSQPTPPAAQLTTTQQTVQGTASVQQANPVQQTGLPQAPTADSTTSSWSTPHSYYLSTIPPVPPVVPPTAAQIAFYPHVPGRIDTTSVAPSGSSCSSWGPQHLLARILSDQTGVIQMLNPLAPAR